MIERHNVPDDDTWHALRQQDVTASHAGAVFGVHEYMTPYELWALKTGRITTDPDETPAMRRGRLLESVAVQVLAEQLPRGGLHHNTGPHRKYLRDTEARIGATPDVIVFDPVRGTGIVQIKTVEANIFRRKWQTPDHTIEPPLWIALQALVEGHLYQASWVAVAALVVGHGLDLHIIEIEQRPQLIKRFYDRVAEFWAMVASGKEPTPDYAKDGEALSRMYEADDGGEIDLSDERAHEIVAQRLALMEEIRVAEIAKDSLDAEMMHRLGNHAAGILGGGKRVTWKTVHRREYTVAETTYRTLRYPRSL